MYMKHYMELVDLESYRQDVQMSIAEMFVIMFFVEYMNVIVFIIIDSCWR